MKTGIIACESQPMTLEGIRAVLAGSEDFEFAAAAASPAEAVLLARAEGRHIVLLDKAFGPPAIGDVLVQLAGVPAVVWGAGMTDAEAIRFLRAGARGVLAKSVAVEELLACLRAVTGGLVWTEHRLLSAASRRRGARAQLTAREREVMELVGQGLKNREVATELGIRPGTVKVHLKHIFEKTGVGDRYGLVLTGLLN